MKIELTKSSAAAQFIDRALHLLLDDCDSLSVIVLAGSAENLLHDSWIRFGLSGKPARASEAEAITRLAAALDGRSCLSDQVERDIKECFNWLRHNNHDADSQTVELDPEVEAISAIDRAITNLVTVAKQVPARDKEFRDYAAAIFMRAQTAFPANTD